MTETIVTLTLPEKNGNGTLVVRRGEVGHVAHFTYTRIDAVATITPI